MDSFIPAKSKVKCQNFNCNYYICLYEDFNGNVNRIICSICSQDLIYYKIPEIGCYTFCRECFAHFKNIHSSFDKCYNCR